jgi:hypothetical protein
LVGVDANLRLQCQPQKFVPPLQLQAFTKFEARSLNFRPFQIHSCSICHIVFFDLRLGARLPIYGWDNVTRSRLRCQPLKFFAILQFRTFTNL